MVKRIVRQGRPDTFEEAIKLAAQYEADDYYLAEILGIRDETTLKPEDQPSTSVPKQMLNDLSKGMAIFEEKFTEFVRPFYFIFF